MDRMDVDMINPSELGLNAKSKVELYRILTVEGYLSLPPYRYCPIDFMALTTTEENKVHCFYHHFWFWYSFRH